MSGLITREALQELQAALTARLLKDVKSDQPSAAVLAVALGLIRLSGLGLEDLDAASRKKLGRLHRLLIDRLLVVLENSLPSAAVLTVALDLLAGHGIGPGVGTALDVAKALRELSASDLPFNSQ